MVCNFQPPELCCFQPALTQSNRERECSGKEARGFLPQEHRRKRSDTRLRLMSSSFSATTQA
jgi:hypothetical protein